MTMTTSQEVKEIVSIFKRNILIGYGYRNETLEHIYMLSHYNNDIYTHFFHCIHLSNAVVYILIY